MSINIKPIRSLLIACILLTCVSCTVKAKNFHDVQFMDEFCIKPHSEYIYRTCNNFSVQVDDYEIEVPKGFDSDLASIPRWYWSVISPNNALIVAPAILHDYLYSCNFGMEKEEVDEIFYYALISNGVSSTVANQMYYAVKLFGKSHYHPKMNCGALITMD